MVKRYRIEGSIYYITSVIYARTKLFVQPSFIIPLIDSLNYYRYQFDIKIIGYVIMPDHIHLLLYPQSEQSIIEFMRDFKRFTSGRITRQAKVERKSEWIKMFEQAGTETERAEFKVWQDSFWEQNIFTEDFLKQKLDYIHKNPVRAGIVNNAIDYFFSSARNYYLDDRHLMEIDSYWM
jgi:REP element-mobilizing transposase RayT